MTSREPVEPFKNTPYVGLFQYALLPSVIRQNRNIGSILLPGHNPYVGYYNHSQKPMYIEGQTKDASTQTDPDAAMVIGEKVMKAYGDDYVILMK